MFFYLALRPAFTLTSFVLLLFVARLAFAASDVRSIAQEPLSSSKRSDLITVSAVGDIMLGTNTSGRSLPPNDGMRFFEDAGSYIQSADIRFGNMEGTLYDGKAPADAKGQCGKCYSFRAPTRFVRTLQRGGFNIMSLANNHSRDMGQVGLLSTQEALTGAGIQWSGKHGGIGEFNVRGVKVAVIAADYYKGGRSVIEPERIMNEIRELNKRFDIVIVTAHVGAEGRGADKVSKSTEIFLRENRGNSYQFSRDAIDAGADLLIMHGPHVPRAMEVYKGRLIAYSLGNFATANGINISGSGGYSPILRVQLTSKGEFYKGHVASFMQVRPDRIVYDDEAKAFKMIRRLSESQFPETAPYFDSKGFIAPRVAADAAEPLP